MAFLSPSPIELIVILVIALLVLGPSRLPETARSIGRGMRELRDSLQGATDGDSIFGRGDDDPEDDDPLEDGPLEEYAPGDGVPTDAAFEDDFPEQPDTQPQGTPGRDG